MPDENGLKRVAWSREPGTWTRAHLSVDGRGTLCGLRIPEPDGVHDVSSEAGGALCDRCEEKLRELAQEPTGVRDWAELLRKLEEGE